MCTCMSWPSDSPDLACANDQLHVCRKRNGIQSRSKLDIKLAEHDLYVAVIDDKLTLKLGPRHDMPDHLLPKDGWKVASAGSDYCIWERC